MKKFITFTLCLLLCIASFGLTACGGNKKEKVDTSIASNGNGGMVVTHGDYVYFVNGYWSYTNYETSNLDKKFDIAGLYRAKLNGAEVSYDENGSVTGAERISSDLAGFESTSLYIFGNYIYYTTPDTEVTKGGDLKTSKLDFYRVKITGGKPQRVYRSAEDASKINFEFYYADGSVYLMVNENGTLKRVNCYGKFSTKTVDTGIASIILPHDDYDVFASDSHQHVYYTKTNSDGKIELYNYNVATNKQEYKKVTDYKTLNLIDYKFDHIFYEASRENYPYQGTEYKLYYRIDATKNAITNLKAEEITGTEYKKLYLLDNENMGYVTQDDSATYYVTYNVNGVGETYTLASSKLDIIAINYNNIYYKAGNDIKCINCYEFNDTKVTNEKSVITLEGIQAYDYDVDHTNLYVYAQKGSNTYLYSISLDEDNAEAKLLGVYDKADIEE